METTEDEKYEITRGNSFAICLPIPHYEAYSLRKFAVFGVWPKIDVNVIQ